ncbi:MAG TPA: PEGA domain-containing protein [Aggregicoccus sp.]|nr:PEGA domain-containing protein [Aggregicoccus sp.]
MKTLQKQSVVRGLSLVWMALMLGSSGCATLIKSKSETVTLQSNPGDADVYIDGAPRGRTPLILELQPNKEYTVVFKKPGYADQAQVITSSVSGKWVVLDVFGGLIPVIIDAATGSWKEFDNPLVNVTLAARRGEGPDELRGDERAADDERYEDERDAVSDAAREERREEPSRARRGGGRERRTRSSERARPAQASDSAR